MVGSKRGASAGFNPRPCVRGDASFLSATLSDSMFQSTPLCEGRLCSAAKAAAVLSCFNPRPCVRGDIGRHCLCNQHDCFNPRPCVRGDKGDVGAVVRGLGFNPRPCVRGDFPQAQLLAGQKLFQSTPLCEGRRPAWGKPYKYLRRFNPRPCVRGDHPYKPGREQT